MKILYNAHIHSLDQSRPQASVLVIDRERVAAIGGPELLDSFGARASREDMGGRTILPGLTDAHLHLQYYALGLQKVDVETPTKAEALRRVAERVAQTPPGKWVLGHGWQQNDWSDGASNGEFPTADDLDAISTAHPILLTAKSLHAAWANSTALKLAGITPDSPDPENGKIVRNTSGQPTGILLETAMEIGLAATPAETSSDVAEAIAQAQTNLWKLGLTGVHDFDRRTCFMALQQLRQDGRLKLRVVKNLPVELLPQASALGLRSGFGDDFLRIGSIKVFMDGALGPRTAAMFQPYLNEPSNRGILNIDGEEFFEHGRQAAESGLSMTVHAIGDRAVHEVLDGFEQLRSYERENRLPALRHRIEHVQIIHPDDAGRLGKLNIIASMQPIHATSDMFAAERYWGERTRLSYAWRTQLNHGAVLAFGSDAPVESPNPFWGLRAAVTRQRVDGAPAPEGWIPEEKLTMPEALAAYTTGPAYTAGWEDRLGRLSPGTLADLIVLENDPFTCHPDELTEMHSAATMVGGEWVYQH